MDNLEDKILRVLQPGILIKGNLQTIMRSVQTVADAIGASVAEVVKELIAMEGRGQVNSAPGDVDPAERLWSIR